MLAASVVTVGLFIGSACGGSDDGESSPGAEQLIETTADTSPVESSETAGATTAPESVTSAAAAVTTPAAGEVSDAAICDAVRRLAADTLELGYGEGDVMLQSMLTLGLLGEVVDGGAEEIDRVIAVADQVAERDCPDERTVILVAYGADSLVAIMQDQG